MALDKESPQPFFLQESGQLLGQFLVTRAYAFTRPSPGGAGRGACGESRPKNLISQLCIQKYESGESLPSISFEAN